MRTYTPEVRRRLPDLSRPLKSWFVRRVWQNALPRTSPDRTGAYRRNLGHPVGDRPARSPTTACFITATSRRTSQRAGAATSSMPFRASRGEQHRQGNRGSGIHAKSGDRQRTSGVRIHHNTLRNDTLKGCKLAGVVCWANRK